MQLLYHSTSICAADTQNLAGLKGLNHFSSKFLNGTRQSSCIHQQADYSIRTLPLSLYLAMSCSRPGIVGCTPGPIPYHPASHLEGPRRQGQSMMLLCTSLHAHTGEYWIYHWNIYILTYPLAVQSFPVHHEWWPCEVWLRWGTMEFHPLTQCISMIAEGMKCGSPSPTG